MSDVTRILARVQRGEPKFICTDNFSDLGGPPLYAFYRLS